MLEVLIAFAVAAVALMGTLSAIASIMQLTDSNREQAMALNVARQKLAELQIAPFHTTLEQFGPASTANSTSFLQLDGGTIKFIFPINASGKLDETMVDELMGMPMDLNGNGNSTDTNVSTNYCLLPVRIQLTWKSPNGSREMSLNTLLVKMK